MPGIFLLTVFLSGNVAGISLRGRLSNGGINLETINRRPRIIDVQCAQLIIICSWMPLGWRSVVLLSPHFINVLLLFLFSRCMLVCNPLNLRAENFFPPLSRCTLRFVYALIYTHKTPASVGSVSSNGQPKHARSWYPCLPNTPTYLVPVKVIRTCDANEADIRNKVFPGSCRYISRTYSTILYNINRVSE